MLVLNKRVEVLPHSHVFANTSGAGSRVPPVALSPPASPEGDDITRAEFIRAIEAVNRTAKRFPRHSTVAKSLLKAKDLLLSAALSSGAETVDVSYQSNPHSRFTLLVHLADPKSGMKRVFHAAVNLLAKPAQDEVVRRIGEPPPQVSQ